MAMKACAAEFDCREAAPVERRRVLSPPTLERDAPCSGKVHRVAQQHLRAAETQTDERARGPAQERHVALGANVHVVQLVVVPAPLAGKPSGHLATQRCKLPKASSEATCCRSSKMGALPERASRHQNLAVER